MGLRVAAASCMLAAAFGQDAARSRSCQKFDADKSGAVDIKDLLDLTCKTVAEYIKQCKTPEEIRLRFNIPNDFTPEEEEEVRKENAWCEEAPS